MNVVALPDYDSLPVKDGAPLGSSWGLWGDTDQLGCLNLLSSAKVLSGMERVSRGLVIPLNASLELFQRPLFDRPPIRHSVTVLPQDNGRDETLSDFNTQCSSQWDGLRHFRSRTYDFYNGLTDESLSMATWAERGIVGRGLLLDVEGQRVRDGRPLDHAHSDGISVDDLERTMRHQGVQLQEGDILLVHTGWLDWARQNHPAGLPSGFHAPGLRPGRDMVRTLWNGHIAAVASDTPSVEVWPPGACATSAQRRAARDDPQAMVDVFMHGDLLALLGLPLGELWDTGRLARACRTHSARDFLLCSAPMNLPGGVASPSNALAIL